MKMSPQGRTHTPEERILKDQARKLGISFHPRMGAERLKKLINEHMQAKLEAPTGDYSTTLGETVETPSGGSESATGPTGDKLYMTEDEYQKKSFGEFKRNAGRLVRVRVTCMNPAKKNWTGEIISVGSNKLGTYKKFIPFNLEEPYHVPWIIYEELKNRECRVVTTVKLPNGQEVNRYKLVKEFAVELLPPLTKEELHELKQRQAMANG